MALQGPIPVEFGTVFPVRRVRGWRVRAGPELRRLHRGEVRPVPRQGHRPAAVVDRGHRPRPRRAHAGGQGQGRRPGPAGHPGRPGRVAVRPGGVHRADRHPVRQPGRAAGLLGQGHRHPVTRPRTPRPRSKGGGGVRSGGGSMAHVGLHVGQDWWTFLSTYPDHSPILTIDAGSTSMAISSLAIRPIGPPWSSPGSWPGRRPSSPPRSSGCTPASQDQQHGQARGPGMVRRPDDHPRVGRQERAFLPPRVSPPAGANGEEASLVPRSRSRVAGEQLAQVDNRDPFAAPVWRSPVYRTPEA